MSERIETNGSSMVEQGNNNGNNFGVDGSERRRQNLPETAHHIRRIFQGQPPRGFRLRQVHPNNLSGIDSNVDSTSSNTNSNGNAPQHSPSNGNANGNFNGIMNDNIPRTRVNLGSNAMEHTPLGDTANGNSNANRTTNVQRLRVNLHRDTPQQFPLDGNGNGFPSDANRNDHVPRLRINMGGRPFVVRQTQQRPNAFIEMSQQQQSQSQQEQRSQRQPSLLHSFGPNGSINMGQNGSVQLRMVQVQVDPLAPQPLPPSVPTNSSAQNTSNTRKTNGKANPKAQDPPDYERYKCEICYEYLNDPVGCGKCASRFCRTCLARVYDSDKQKQQPTKCPVCRCEYEEAVPDLQLYDDSKGAPTLPCRFVCVGCPERNIPLSDIAKHEQVCDHVPVRCRYAPYGCQWIGKRGLCGAHEEFGCKLAPVGKFVDAYRQTKADHTMRLEMIGQQAAGSLRMSHVLRQTYTRDNQRKSLADTLRLVQYCHSVTGLTPHFLMTKDLWVSYWRNNESRAGVVNFCICLPFLAAALGVVGHATRSFFELFEETSPDRTLSILARVLDGAKTNVTNHEKVAKLIQKIQAAEAEELLITSFLGLCVGTLGILVVMLSYIDTKSNISWDKISLPYIGGRFPLVGDVMAISIFTLLLALMEYHQSGVKAGVLWFTIVITSTFFPALIFSISHYTARLVTRTPRPAAFNMMEVARLVEPCMFGLRFSMVMNYFGIAATLDATVVFALIPQTTRLYLKNTLFDHLPRTALYVFLTSKSAIWTFKVQNLVLDSDLDLSILQSAITVESAQSFFTSSPDAIALSELLDKLSTSMLATVALMITSYVINSMFALGNTLGDYIARTSQEELSPEGIARGTAKEYSSVGLLAFGSWVMMIALLARI